MLVHLKQLLTPEDLEQARTLLQAPDAPWIEGRRNAGDQTMHQKNNEQLAPDSDSAEQLRTMVLAAARRDAGFFSAALPKKIFNPLFNRYSGGSNHYGPHVDGAVLQSRTTQQWVRTDISCTVFFSQPDEYDGGELVVHDSYGRQELKLSAGDAVLYPGTSVHEVRPVTRGTRLGSFFWIESMVRSDEQRRLLFELDTNLLALRRQHGESPETTRLTGTYHNLMRMWADTQ